MQGECVPPTRSLWGSSTAPTALAHLFGAVVVLWKSTALFPSIEFSCGTESASSKTSLFEQGFVIHLGHDGHPCPAHPATSSPWVDVHMHEPNLTREDKDIGEVVDEILEDPFFTFVPPPYKMILLSFTVEECAISMCGGVYVQIALPITSNSFR